MKWLLMSAALFIQISKLCAEDGYKLWLGYKPLVNSERIKQFSAQTISPVVLTTSATGKIISDELSVAVHAMTGKKIVVGNNIAKSAFSLLIGTVDQIPPVWFNLTKEEKKKLGPEGFIIKSDVNRVLIIGNTDISLLYGLHHYLRLVQAGKTIDNLNILSTPRINIRMLNHWDNLDRTIERGYAGFSIWNWHALPHYIDKRYIDYARANASIGINAVSLTNVNANATILSANYLTKVKALAEVFRPFGIKVYLTARFSAPMELGKLSTADPMDSAVQQWWNKKANEIYQSIPDFGGFLVKANSEGQPGPQDYQRTHAQGANMLARALKPYGGIVVWRAFVYNPKSDDRFKQAYEEFNPLDGQFDQNVILQVKNGPIDFQPNEPFSPLFGSMKKTPLAMEFQLTQEYLGQGTHLVFLLPMFKNVLAQDTYASGKGSTVAKVVDGSIYPSSLTLIAGVSNIGNDINWCGHPFAQANWYGFGRLSWDHEISAKEIAREWIIQTLTKEDKSIGIIENIMLKSYETLVKYMTPIGLTHIMYDGHHFGPMPWGKSFARQDWNPVYYHRADSFGIGFTRTISGTNALAQYHPSVRENWTDSNTCPDEYLLWFHHVSWNHIMHSGRTLWEELCLQYYSGTDEVKSISRQWASLRNSIDPDQFRHVEQLLQIQYKESVWWRNACLLYFQTHSGIPIPSRYERPDQTLDAYKNIHYKYVPGH